MLLDRIHSYLGFETCVKLFEVVVMVVPATGAATGHMSGRASGFDYYDDSIPSHVPGIGASPHSQEHGSESCACV